jgi:hypothetical protein
MLPKTLKYGSKIESAVARSSRVNFQPMQSESYNSNDVITINIPTRNNLVMVGSESYLKFTLNALTASAAVSIRSDSCGPAHGLIQRIRIFHGSNLKFLMQSIGKVIGFVIPKEWQVIIF